MKLEYFDVQDGATRGQRSVKKLGSYELSDLKDIVTDFKEVSFGFQLVAKDSGDVISFSFESDSEKEKWLYAFEEGLRMAKGRR